MALKMATKILAAISFTLKLFPNFWSNDILYIYFSWNKVARADTIEPANGTWWEKVWKPLT